MNYRRIVFRRKPARNTRRRVIKHFHRRLYDYRTRRPPSDIQTHERDLHAKEFFDRADVEQKIRMILFILSREIDAKIDLHFHLQRFLTENSGDIDKTERIKPKHAGRQFRGLAKESVAAAADPDGIVGDKAVSSRDKLKCKLRFPGAGRPADQRSSIEDRHQHPVDDPAVNTFFVCHYFAEARTE